MNRNREAIKHIETDPLSVATISEEGEVEIWPRYSQAGWWTRFLGAFKDERYEVIETNDSIWQIKYIPIRGKKWVLITKLLARKVFNK